MKQAGRMFGQKHLCWEYRAEIDLPEKGERGDDAKGTGTDSAVEPGDPTEDVPVDPCEEPDDPVHAWVLGRTKHSGFINTVGVFTWILLAIYFMFGSVLVWIAIACSAFWCLIMLLF